MDAVRHRGVERVIVESEEPRERFANARPSTLIDEILEESSGDIAGFIGIAAGADRSSCARFQLRKASRSFGGRMEQRFQLRAKAHGPLSPEKILAFRSSTW